jgi:hypothetical protein
MHIGWSISRMIARTDHQLLLGQRHLVDLVHHLQWLVHVRLAAPNENLSNPLVKMTKVCHPYLPSKLKYPALRPYDDFDLARAMVLHPFLRYWKRQAPLFPDRITEARSRTPFLSRRRTNCTKWIPNGVSSRTSNLRL